MEGELQSLISATTALLAVILSPAVNWIVTRRQVQVAERQIRASTVSSRRQDWIDALRDDLAESVALAGRIAGYRQRAEQDSAASEALAEAEFRADELAARIKLRLDPGEAHDHLRDALDGMQAAARGDAPHRPLDQARDHCIDETHRVIRAEWAKLKRSE